MKKRTVDLSRSAPWLDLVSYGRRGPFTPAQREHIARTVASVPEVLVRVSGGGREVGAVRAHLRYIGRHGRVTLETDDGPVTTMKEVHALLDDWNLEGDELEGRRRYTGRPGRKSPKLVHNIIFSMPEGTQPNKVQQAVRRFGHEQFALRHRYAMALHTDTGKPHVHLVVKALSEQGERLNITPPLLREWRREFARHLRALGVPANATDRAIRGESRTPKKNGIYRAMRRGDSSWMRERTETIAQQLRTGTFKPPPGKFQLLRTRQTVIAGLRAWGQQLEAEGDLELAARTRQYAAAMTPPLTDQEMVSDAILQGLNRPRPVQQAPPTR
jgi:Relaxase/Mobilisation nuclease domain